MNTTIQTIMAWNPLLLESWNKKSEKEAALITGKDKRAAEYVAERERAKAAKAREHSGHIIDNQKAAEKYGNEQRKKGNNKVKLGKQVGSGFGLSIGKSFGGTFGKVGKVAGAFLGMSGGNKAGEKIGGWLAKKNYERADAADASAKHLKKLRPKVTKSGNKHAAAASRMSRRAAE